MCVASDASDGCRPDWRAQYCITIAIDAAPHPSFDCCTKGTSSQIPGSDFPEPAKIPQVRGTERVQKHRETAITFATRPGIATAIGPPR